MNKLFLSSTIIGCLLFVGCTSQPPAETDEFGLTIGQEEEAKTAFDVQVKKVACEDSGGTFTNEKCECPDNTEQDGSQTYTFDEALENCVDQFGLPGGVLGEEVKANHPINE